jgi:hypothetical protein
MANVLGKALENAVEDMLRRNDFVQIDDRQRAAFTKSVLDFGDDDLPTRWYARNVKRFENLYKVRFFADFVIYDAVYFPHGLVIEVKAQEKAGSVDEKYVFTVLSLKELKKRYGVQSWLVFSGTGARACAVEWIRKQQEKGVFEMKTESELRRAFASIE